MSDTARAYRDPCGCRSTDARWVRLCNEHDAEWRTTRARWMAEHYAASPDVTPFTTSREAGLPGAPMAPGVFDTTTGETTP